MRNVFKYYDFNKQKLLKALLNKSKDIQYISILVSNLDRDTSNLPRDYINYDLLAGVGLNYSLSSNHNSFEKLKQFHLQKKDWLFGYLSYDLKNETEELSSNNIDKFNTDNLSFFVPEYVFLLNNQELEVQTYNSKEICDDFVKSFNFSDLLIDEVKINFSRRENKKSYLRKVQKIKDHIQKGDIYEMNYCQEFYAAGVKISAESVFLELNQKKLQRSL